MFQAVVTSCCATEYAVAVVGSVTSRSDATLKAWLTPAPPGVTEVTFAIEFPPTTCMTTWKLTGIPKAARKTAITPSFAHQPRNEGRNTQAKYLRGFARILPPCFACTQSFLIQRHANRQSRTIRKIPPTMMIAVAHGWSASSENLMSNDP